MAVFECPLCCAENFSDIHSLENHLLDLCENIICPICELQFKTIRTLAAHLGQGCKSDLNVKESLINLTNDREIVKEFNPSTQESVHSYVCESTEDIPSENINSFSDIHCSSGTSSHVQNELYNDEVLQHESVYKNKDDNACLLYMCSVCNITFSSIEEHLNKFHQDESVLVDEFSETNITEKEADETNRASQSESTFSTYGLLSRESNTNYLPGNEMDSLLIVNWEGNSCIDKKLKISEKLSDDSYTQKGHWIPYKNLFYFRSNSELKTGKIMKKKNVVDSENSQCWPPALQKYSLATFVTVNNDSSDLIDSIICENKPYIFNGHRVRVLKVRGRDGVPCLEDLPFPEKPPDTIFPVLEPSHAQPNDLVGSFSVMWPCHLCGTLTYHWSDLAKHSCSSSLKYFPCTLCKKTFHSRRSLNNHYSVYHKIARTSSGSLPCTLCPAKVQTASHLEKHLAMHKKNDLIKCDVCDSMVQKISFDIHLKAHGKDGPLSLVCLLCNRPFKGENELSLHVPQCHLQQNKDDNLKCDLCRIAFPDVNVLREHMVSHNIPIKPHLCSFCPKSYYRLIDKVIHERVHTRSKPHSCSECGRCFRLRHSLVAHLRIHTGERPYKCSLCERRFRTKHLQRSHVLTHSAQSQFKCKHCNKQFPIKEKLEMHEKSHKKPFVCVECKRVFYSLNFAKKHLVSHKNNELRYTCNMCPNMFTRAAYLESHLRTSHGLDTLASISISSQKTYKQMEESADNRIKLFKKQS